MNEMMKKIIFFFIKKRIYSYYNYKVKNLFSLHKSNIVNDKNNELIHANRWKVVKKKINIKWYSLYSFISNSKDPNFIPEDVYYGDIERTLNNSKFNFAYADKNNLDRIINGNLGPHIFLRNIDGAFYDQSYNNLKVNDSNLFSLIAKNDKVIIKKSFDSAGGKFIELFYNNDKNFYTSNNIKLDMSFLNRSYGKNYLIQECIKQHNYYKKFNESSVNTVRVMTYRSVKNEKIIILHSVLRFGAENQIVDNQASGGYSCGINSEGVLNNFYIDKNGNKYNMNNILKNHNDEKYIYKYEDMLVLAKSLAKLFPYHRLLGFDFCLNENGEVKLLEINNQSIEINFIQMSCGPLFREYTDEIINYCTKNKRTFTVNESE